MKNSTFCHHAGRQTFIGVSVAVSVFCASNPSERNSLATYHRLPNNKKTR
ncbi:MAG: hypothetical protein MR862_02445 [Clostridia bacterium]|nr:hypothetical protein [Clostridia bacterium]